MTHRLNVVYLPVDELIPYAGNARTHSTAQVNQIAASINAFKFINPILTNESNLIIAGHTRVLAAKKVGLTEVPVVKIEHLTEDEIRAYTLADNKLAENAGWDENLLRIEIAHLCRVDVDVDVDLTGFSTAEMDVLVSPLGSVEPQAPLPDLPTTEETTARPGDIFEIGPHRIGCGDCRDSQLVDALMDRQKAQLVITDPPYNVRIQGHARGQGQANHPDFLMASGEMSSEAFSDFLTDTVNQAVRISLDGALHYVFMDWRHLPELLIAAKQLYGEQINLCVWNKTNGGMGSLYRSQHELVSIFKVGKARHINNVELGQHGRYQTNVWTYAGANAFGEDRNEALSMHPTVKPTALIADAIMDVTNHGDIVFDGFLGSGTTLIAAEQTGRIGYGIELDPRYVDVIINRLMAATSYTATHIVTGANYDDLRQARQVEEAV